MSGWHAASALPKPEELCAAPGSTYRLSGPAGVLQELAQRLPAEGVGLRRTEGFGALEVATGPWRPRGQDSPPASGTGGAGADERLIGLSATIQDLGLSDDQKRWVISALRDLQLDRERTASGQTQPADAEDLVSFLLGQPTAQDLSGRQRDGLRTVFGETSPQLLRDLATLLASAAPASQGEQPR